MSKATSVQARARGVVAVVLVTVGLVASGMPAMAAAPKEAKPPTSQPAQPTVAPAAPAVPPVTPTTPEPEKAEPAPPLPVGPVPDQPKAGDELVDRRTERSKTFATATIGQYETELYAEPVHFKDAQGAYQPIDAGLGDSKDGVRQSKANAFVLEIADDANAASLARLRLDDDHSVGFSLEGAGAVRATAEASSST